MRRPLAILKKIPQVPPTIFLVAKKEGSKFLLQAFTTENELWLEENERF